MSILVWVFFRKAFTCGFIKTASLAREGGSPERTPGHRSIWLTVAASEAASRMFMTEWFLPVRTFITTDRDLLGHEDISKTEIYLQVATGANGLGVVSPLDRMGVGEELKRMNE